nr:hypothetical protein [Tanacetum cinerariifolium]
GSAGQQHAVPVQHAPVDGGLERAVSAQGRGAGATAAKRAMEPRTVSG